VRWFLFYIDKPFWTVDTLFYTEIDENFIIPKYLFFKLKTIKLEDLNVGSAVPSLTTVVLNQLPITIPKSIKEQKAIAQILTAFDDKMSYF
jgi:type I restriction enzyme S subunit